MNHTPEAKEIRRLAKEAGAIAVGWCEAEPVSEEQNERFEAWLAAGMHGELQYMERYRDIRRDPRQLLPGARTVISLAFSYAQSPIPNPQFSISSYALGEDYHITLRRRLQSLLDYLDGTTSTQSPIPDPQSHAQHARLCIDSAPLHERYFAVKAGIGTIGLNGALIVPSHGPKCFLATIFTTAEIKPPESQKTNPSSLVPRPSSLSREACLQCGKCIAACPTGAITKQGIDARLCLSALTIEHRGDFTEEQLHLLRDHNPRRTIFGCDICRDACPTNRPLPAEILPEFRPVSSLFESLFSLTGGQFKRAFAQSPLLRTGLKGLRRNLDAPKKP